MSPSLFGVIGAEVSFDFQDNGGVLPPLLELPFYTLASATKQISINAKWHQIPMIYAYFRQLGRQDIFAYYITLTDILLGAYRLLRR